MGDQICLNFDGEGAPAEVATVLAVQLFNLVLFRVIPQEKQRKLYKILSVYLLTIVIGTLVGFREYGWISAFFRANLIAYAQVFGHQVYKNIGR